MACVVVAAMVVAVLVAVMLAPGVLSFEEKHQ
jgi:hypothetical protein